MFKVSWVVATVDEGIVKKIFALVGKGVYQVREIERHLKIFVKNDFVKNGPLSGDFMCFTDYFRRIVGEEKRERDRRKKQFPILKFFYICNQ